MSHGRDKPRREKRRPKKEKLSAGKTGRGSEVIDHISQVGQASEERKA